MSIRVHIERLVLDGLPIGQGQGPLFQAAVEAELGRLLVENGIPAGLRHASGQARIAAPTLRLQATPDATALGTRVGAVVHGAIAGTTANGDGGSRK